MNSSISDIDPSEVLYSRGTQVTTVKCHGSLLAENRYKVEDMFKETPFKGRVIIDLSDVDRIDSAGLGSLMRFEAARRQRRGREYAVCADGSARDAIA